MTGGLTLEGHSREGQEGLERILLTIETLFLHCVKSIAILPPSLPLGQKHFFCLSKIVLVLIVCTLLRITPCLLIPPLAVATCIAPL